MENNKDENRDKSKENKKISESSEKKENNNKIVNIWEKRKEKVKAGEDKKSKTQKNADKKDNKKEPDKTEKKEKESQKDEAEQEKPVGGIIKEIRPVFSSRVKKSKSGKGKRYSNKKTSESISDKIGYISRFKRPSEKKTPQRYEKAVVRGSDREVLSYEELPLDNYERKVSSQEMGNRKKMGAAAVIVLVLCILVFAVTSGNMMNIESCANWLQYDVLGTGSSDGYPVLISGSEVSSGNITKLGSKIVYASNSNIVALDSSGNQIFSRQHSFSTPVLVGNGTRALVYDLGGKGYRIDSLDSVVYESNGDMQIITGDMGANGSYAIVTQHDEYLSYMRVYNASNQEVYTYSFSEYYINAVSVSDDGTKIIASGISAKNGDPVSAVYYLSITDETPLEFFEIDNTVVYSVEYLKSDKVAFVGNNSCGVIDLSKKEVVRNSYNDMELTAYDIDRDLQSIVVSLSRNGDGRLCTICYYSSSGQIETSFDTDCRIISLDAYSNKIGVIDNGTARLFDKSGSEIYNTDAGADAAALVMDNQREAYVLGISEIRYIDFTKEN